MTVGRDDARIMRRRAFIDLRQPACWPGSWPGRAAARRTAGRRPPAAAVRIGPVREALAVRPVRGRRRGAAAGRGGHPLRPQLAAVHRLRRRNTASSSCRRARTRPTATDDVFDFPVGTVIAKTFAYPHDARDPSKGQRLIETRILKREPDGWVGLPYVWNEAQTEATLDVAGGTVDVRAGSTPTASRGPTTTSSPTPTSARDATRRARP